MQQKRVIDGGEMPRADGSGEYGYADKVVWDYARGNVKSKARLKEWDYYLIGDDEYALCVTLADNGYFGALSASLVDFVNLRQTTKSAVAPFPMGKVGMPKTPERGDAVYRIGKSEFVFTNDGAVRKIKGVFYAFENKDPLLFNVTVTNPPETYIAIATPFKQKGRFYLNAKLNCMTANGAFSVGATEHVFNNALATLDWGRGAWSYDNTWLWGSLQTRIAGNTFGLNLGYGFGEPQATENAAFYNGRMHKLGEVTFHLPKVGNKYDYAAPYEITSDDDRLRYTFTPVIDRYAPVNLGVLAMIPHQVFGKFSGYTVLDDGTRIEVTDALGFCERVRNKW